MTEQLRNQLGLGVEYDHDDHCIQFSQNTTLDMGMEVMVYYPPDWEQYADNPDEVDDRVGPYPVVVTSVKELATLLEEVLAGDYRKFNRLGDTTDA